MSKEDFIRAIPKVELHLHLEGAMQKDTLLTIAEQNDLMSPGKQFQLVVSWLDRPDYTRLDTVIRSVSQWLQQPEDLTKIVYELGVGLSKQNVRYAEVSINPTLYMDNMELTFEQFLTAINDGRDRAQRGWGVVINWILIVPRDQPRRADDLVRWATGTAAKKGGVVGLGLSGREDAQPVAQFERAFNTAGKKGLARVAQAGEIHGAEEILEVIHDLEPDRIVDGWGAADAPDVLKLLVDNEIPLTVCMARALCLGQVATYAAYPLRDLYDAGVTLTIGSGMPGWYKTTLVDEYLAAVEHSRLSIEEIEEIALNAVRASLLPDDEKAAMLADFTSEYERLRAEHINPATA